MIALPFCIFLFFSSLLIVPFLLKFTPNLQSRSTASKRPCYKAACKTKCILCTYQFCAFKKPEAVKSPKIFVWLDLPRKWIKTKKMKGFLLAVNYYCVYDRKRTSNRSAMSVFFLYLWPSTRSSRHCFQQSTWRVK